MCAGSGGETVETPIRSHHDTKVEPDKGYQDPAAGIRRYAELVLVIAWVPGKGILQDRVEEARVLDILRSPADNQPRPPSEKTRPGRKMP